MTEPANPDHRGGGLVRLRIDLGYDGAAFSGWARQPGRRTVQEELENALATVLRTGPVPVVCAGRTDAGVHARGQVVHADLPPDSSYDGDATGLGRHLAGILPPDIGIRAVAVAPAGFDARFSALWRRYAYRVTDHPFGPDPLRRRDVLAHRGPLDVAAMDSAAKLLVGTHDFAAFCRPREGSTTVRTLHELAWSRDEDGLVVARAVADAFCHNMVRALVGALLAVGAGRRPIDWPFGVLAGRERQPDVPVVPAHGLTLEEVRYPPDQELATRAALARRRREVQA